MWLWWLQGSTMGFLLFHLQHYAHVPNIYYDIPRNQHERDLASLIGDFPDTPLGCGHCTFEILLHHALKILSLVKAVTQLSRHMFHPACCRCRFVLMHKSGRSSADPLACCIACTTPWRCMGSMMLLVCTAGSTFQYIPEWFKWATCGIEVLHTVISFL